jgi:hypothetical protein
MRPAHQAVIGGVVVDPPPAVWLQQALLERIATLDWKAAVQDAERFVLAIEQPSLRLWSERFYTQRVEQLFKDKP